MEIKSKNDILEEIKKIGYRITKHRKTIIDYIAQRKDHPSVKQIYNEIKINDPKISLATVYNTLNLLVKIKFLKEIEFEDKDNRYDTNLSPHLNLICSKCGSIVDFEYELPVSPEVVRKKNGFLTREYRIEYHGVCTNCAKKE